MQRLLILPFLVLFSSCVKEDEDEKDTSEWQKIDEGVYEYVSSPWSSYVTKKSGNTPAGIKVNLFFDAKFTVSAEDETTYFIIEWTQGKRISGPPSDGHAELQELQFMDVHGNILYKLSDIEKFSSKSYGVIDFRSSNGITTIRGTNKKITKSILERTDDLGVKALFRHQEVAE